MCVKYGEDSNLIPFPNKKYKIIYADPPYYFKSYSKKGEGRSATKHYPCMGIDDIYNLPVSSITDNDCILFLWVTDPFLEKGLEIIKRWSKLKGIIDYHLSNLFQYILIIFNPL